MSKSHAETFRAVIRRAVASGADLHDQSESWCLFTVTWSKISKLDPLPDNERLWDRIVAEETGRLPRKERAKKPQPPPEGQSLLFDDD